MSGTVTTAVRILDNEYQVRCREDELDELATSASELDQRMRTIRDEGKTAGLGRLAIMAALNIAHDNLQLRQRLATAEQQVKRPGGAAAKGYRGTSARRLSRGFGAAILLGCLLGCLASRSHP